MQCFFYKSFYYEVVVSIFFLSQINIQTDIEQVFVGKYFGVIQGQGKIVIVSFTGTVIVASFSKNSTIGFILF